MNPEVKRKSELKQILIVVIACVITAVMFWLPYFLSVIADKYPIVNEILFYVFVFFIGGFAVIVVYTHVLALLSAIFGD